MFHLFSDKKKAKKRLGSILKDSEPPTFQPGALKLLKLLRDPDSDLREVAEVMSWDPGMVVRVLRTVNSAAFGLRNKVDSVQHAVSILGRAKAEQLVLSVAVKDAMPTKAVAGFDSKRFWNTAFFRASLARAIAEQLHPAQQASSFTAGLLQDMAIPLLAHARDDYGQVLQEWHADSATHLHNLEQREFGWSHDEAGGLLAVEWELPEELARAIQLHHDDEATDFALPPALKLVAIHRETQAEHGMEALIEDGRSLFGLEPDWLQGSIASSLEQARDLSDSF